MSIYDKLLSLQRARRTEEQSNGLLYYSYADQGSTMSPCPAVWMRGAARLRAAATTASRSAAASAVGHSTEVDWNGAAGCAALLHRPDPIFESHRSGSDITSCRTMRHSHSRPYQPAQGRRMPVCLDNDPSRLEYVLLPETLVLTQRPF